MSAQHNHMLSTDFLLSGGVSDSIPIPEKFQVALPDAVGSSHTRQNPCNQETNLSIDLLAVATAHSTCVSLPTASPAATKRLKDILLDDSPVLEAARDSLVSTAININTCITADVPDQQLEAAAGITPNLSYLHAHPANPGYCGHESYDKPPQNDDEHDLRVKLAAAMRSSSKMKASIKVLQEEKDALHRTSILTKSGAGQRSLNATSINLLEQLAADDQEQGERLIVSLRTTIASLEQQNQALERQVRVMQEQLSILTFSKAGADLEAKENSTLSRGLHLKLETAQQTICALQQEGKAKDATIEALNQEIARLRTQLEAHVGANVSMSHFITEAVPAAADCSQVTITELQGKLEMHRLMNKQYEESLATLIREQKMTESMLAQLMNQATFMNARLDSIERNIVTVTRDRIINIYRKRLESTNAYAMKRC